MKFCPMNFLLVQNAKFYDEIFGLLGDDENNNDLDSEVENLISERNTARKNKDFKRSDEIRDKLKSMGIILEDTPQGTKWKREL